MRRQSRENRDVLHLLYATPAPVGTFRGKEILPIQDLVPLHDISVSIRVRGGVESVTLVPQAVELEIYGRGRARELYRATRARPRNGRDRLCIAPAYWCCWFHGVQGVFWRAGPAGCRECRPVRWPGAGGGSITSRTAGTGSAFVTEGMRGRPLPPRRPLRSQAALRAMRRQEGHSFGRARTVGPAAPYLPNLVGVVRQ